ncbi:restriction endonuclease subunit S [Nostoc sp. DedSLP04]|uniref:restriction endonuclease subunit S n=1 Tax=Nostoc sp. DedSLP04 TaxID=3075401 RepID=UPI002AD3C61B|nr:restriction endonuclease subunit S [Nostoc sp. DedSLP04]MDZ8031858.1 restriction endonuclease subunit S [Nostoc sp. DedSLP04]
MRQISNFLLLKDLLVLTKDGEWGKSEPTSDSIEMYIIRGTDFAAVRYGNLSNVPIRYISEKIAERKSLQPNDILIETAGGTKEQPTGRTVFLKPRIFEKASLPITCASFSRFLRVNPQLAVPEYIYWYLQFLYQTGKMEQHQIQHTGVARFQYTRFAQSVNIPLPSHSTQQRIVDILSTYDNLIDNNNRRIALLEESIHQLYKEWFVRSRFPGYESVKVVDGIPEGWNRKRLKDIALSIRQSIHPSNTEPNTPYVGLEHIPRQSMALTSWGYSHEVDSNKFVFTKGDILFGKIRPYFHKVVFAPVNGICSSDAIVIRPINQDLFGLTLSLVSSVAFVDYTSKTSKEGSKMPRANWDVMEQYPILIPNPKLLQEFNNLVSLVTYQITSLIFTNQRLRQARDLLLPRLMNGSIAV